MKELEGKTIKSIETPKELKIKIIDDDDGTFSELVEYDDNIVITFTDGTILKLSSWDYEGYRSGIHKEILKVNN